MNLLAQDELDKVHVQTLRLTPGASGEAGEDSLEVAKGRELIGKNNI
jgi:hypothetical protein